MMVVETTAKSLPARAAATMLRYSMAAAGGPIGVAVSGGADSVALLHVLHHLRRAAAVLHVNHCLRGDESDSDAAFVRALAAELGLPCVVETADPRGLPGNLECNARRLRYEFFAQARRQLGLEAVAVGHTQSDQAETVLFRLLRGSGPAGLAAMPPHSAERGIVRPLIEVSRHDVVAWLTAQGIGWREDSSNRSLAFDRNRIRHQLLPQLRREWNPAIDETLARTAAILADEEQYWHAETARHLAECRVAADPGGALILDVSRLRPLPLAVLRRVLRAAIAQVRGDLQGIGWEHLEACRELVCQVAGEGGESLPGLDARRSLGWLRLAVPAAKPVPYALPISVPSTVGLPGGERLSVRVVQAEPGPGYNTNARVSWEKVAQPVLVRSWQPGDRYRPKGYNQSRKLKDLFQEHKVPSWDRASWPIIVGDGGIVVWSRQFGPSADLQPDADREVGELVLEISEELPGG